MSYCLHGGEGNGNPLQYPCLENSTNRGVWQATVHGVAELDTTERLSTHTQHTHTLPPWVPGIWPARPSLCVTSACPTSSLGSTEWTPSARTAMVADYLPLFSFPSFCLPFPYIDSFVFLALSSKKKLRGHKTEIRTFFSQGLAAHGRA